MVHAASTRLVLVRHGHTLSNGSPGGMRLSGWTDTPLSELGLREADLVAEALRGAPCAALYASPLERALRTAAAIGAALRLPVRVEPGLREIHCGAVDGLGVEQVRREHADAWRRNAEEADEEFRWPGGESYREFRARCLRAVRAIAARHPGERAVLVTHAGLVSQVLGWASDQSCARWSAWRPRNASISALDWSPRGRRIVAFDEGAHLARRAEGRATPPRPAA
jgi:alpha-ribazole phosphatase/probable phosphoglycerate mutase